MKDIFELAETGYWQTDDVDILKLKDEDGNTVAHYLAKNNENWSTNDPEILELEDEYGDKVAHLLSRCNENLNTDDADDSVTYVWGLNNIEGDDYKKVVDYFIRNNLHSFTDSSFGLLSFRFHVNKHGRVKLTTNNYDHRFSIIYNLLRNPRVKLDYKVIIKAIKNVSITP